MPSFIVYCYLLFFLSWVEFTAGECHTKCSVDNQVVETSKQEPTVPLDVFILASAPSSDYEYYNDGSFITTPLLLRYYARRPEDVRVHIFSQSDSMLAYAKEFGFITHDMRDFTSLEQKFLELYKPNHHSINTMYYEFLCFYRWLMFAEAIKQWNEAAAAKSSDRRHTIERILTIDSDVIVTMDVNEFYNRIVNTVNHVYHEEDITPTEMDLIVVSLGAVHLWSLKGMNNYASFITDWYNQPSDVILERTKQNGGYLYRQLHFSDMNMINVFTNANPTTRNNCLTVHNIATTAVHSNRRQEYHHCILNTLQCVPIGQYDLFVPGSRFVVETNSTYAAHGKDGKPKIMIRDDKEKYPSCLIHFQGDNGKRDYPLFARLLLGKAGIPYPKNMTGTILVQPQRAQHIFYISSHGTKHHIANYDTFLKLGFDHVPLRKGVPWDVVNSFDDGEVIDDGSKPLPRRLQQVQDERKLGNANADTKKRKLRHTEVDTK